MKKIETKVESKVKEIINKLKSSHAKFEDPDFGPTEKDEYGAVSFYGPPKAKKDGAIPDPAGGSKYPAPHTLKWERPLYDDNKFVEPRVKLVDENGEEVEDEEECEDEEEGDEFDDEFGFQADNGPKVNYEKAVAILTNYIV